MQKSQKADWQTSIVFNCSTLQVLYSAKVCYLPCSAERAGIGKQCMSPQSSGIMASYPGLLLFVYLV